MTARRPTQQDVAKLAGVSRATVSLVLNNQSNSRVPISQETQQRVLAAVQELGYAPNPVARMLARGMNNLIGVFTYEPTFPYESEDFYYPFLIGIERGAQQMGYDVLLFTRSRIPGQRNVYADGQNILRLADGAILLGAYPDRNELCRLMDEQYPFVYIGRREVPRCDIAWVNSDYMRASSDAARGLIGLGHRALGFVGYRQNQESFQDRLAGCRAAADAATGVTLVVLPQDMDAHRSDLVLAAIEDNSLTALMCADESTFSAIMDGMTRSGIRIPEDLSVLCLGAIDRFENRSRQPAYVRLDRPAVGEAAVRSLVSRLRGDALVGLSHVLIPSQFVPGATMAAPAVRHALQSH